MNRRLFVLALAATLSLAAAAFAGKYNKTLSIGDDAPDCNNLEGTDGKTTRLATSRTRRSSSSASPATPAPTPSITKTG